MAHRMLKKVLDQIDYVNKTTLEKIIWLAIEIAREGREGRKVGTLFVISDAENVLKHSRPLILDPLFGHPDDKKHIDDPERAGDDKGACPARWRVRGLRRRHLPFRVPLHRSLGRRHRTSPGTREPACGSRIDHEKNAVRRGSRIGKRHCAGLLSRRDRFPDHPGDLAVEPAQPPYGRGLHGRSG